eukprot:TRINITY_DN228_c0_g1_i1.p1 TRINITY_DN228_c0_g1~~TRINITY_DN228_c0_g1_i1.p1  ORF type:complete len:1015 (-),score=272.16 TRINITY_DN228_c0_g1_i1:297-3341(-)
MAEAYVDNFGFNFTKEKLRELFENYPEDAKKLEEYGGVQGLASGLKSSVSDGLNPSEGDNKFEERIEAFSSNTTPPAPHQTFFQLFWGAFEDSTVIILCVAAVVSLVLGVTVGHGDGSEDTGWIEGVAILIAVIIVATVTATNEFQKEKQFRQLNDRKNDKPVKVVRGGKEIEVSIYEIYVGDVVKLDTGDAVPADGVFLEGHDMKTDESAMTGETTEQKKEAKQPYMLSGCQVTAGAGYMMVTGVGIYSEWGMTLSKLTEERENTPLQDNLEAVATSISKVGVAVAALTFIALLIIWIVHVATQGFTVSKLGEVVNFFIIGVAIIAVAVPEGLPLAVTISLAYSMKKMMNENNLVRHLEACETMGGATNICSDKTGTLTQNMMTVVEAFMMDQYHSQIPPASQVNEAFSKLFAESIAINSSAFIQERVVTDLGQPDAKKPAGDKEMAALDIMSVDINRLKIVGSKTEGALLLLTRHFGINYETIRKQLKERLYKMWTFNADRKRMSVIIRNGGGFRLFCKGASEVVIEDCVKAVNARGDVVDMSGELRQQVVDAIDTMATRGLRTLCLGYRDFTQDGEWDEDHDPPDNHLTFLAVVGIKDPVRPEVPGAVATCHKAGITVRMVTGDNIKTAKFIATECNIFNADQGDIAMEGPVFRRLPRDELDQVLLKLKVLARSSPSDKHLLVSRLRELGEVVAVTGDGTNDAPALKVADVGLSMGITGTEVAKEASDIVILNDNFSSIVAAVKWGRGVYDNIRKFLQFQLTVNVAALIVAFISAVSDRGTPLTAVQLLWVNLIMDTLAALALGTEHPDDSLLLRKPYGRYDRLISSTMWRNIFSQSLFQVTILFGVIYLGPYIWQVEEGSRVHYTMVFNTFVWCQVFNEINARKVNNEMNVLSGLQTSLPFLLVIIFTVGGQLFIVSVGGEFSKTTKLTIPQWFSNIGIGAFSLVIGFISRLVPPPKLPPVKRPDPPKLNEPADDDEEEDSDEEVERTASGKPKKRGVELQPLVAHSADV